MSTETGKPYLEHVGELTCCQHKKTKLRPRSAWSPKVLPLGRIKEGRRLEACLGAHAMSISLKRTLRLRTHKKRRERSSIGGDSSSARFDRSATTRQVEFQRNALRSHES